MALQAYSQYFDKTLPVLCNRICYIHRFDYILPLILLRNLTIAPGLYPVLRIILKALRSVDLFLPNNISFCAFAACPTKYVLSMEASCIAAINVATAVIAFLMKILYFHKTFGEW